MAASNVARWTLALALFPCAARPAAADPPEAEGLRRWRSGAAVRLAGVVSSLTGGGLGLAGSVAVWRGAPGVGQGLLYGATGAIGAGFTLSAVGLGLQHRGLERLGVDPGWGLYAAGTALGGAGLLAGGAASFLRGTEYAPEEQRGPLALSLAIAGASCLITASVLYLVDGGRLRRAFLRWQQTR